MADRVAWCEGEDSGALIVHPALRGAYDGLLRLRDEAYAFRQDPQVVHGDMTGNVLFSAAGTLAPPVVIDLSPYFRPAAYAEAIIVADAFVDVAMIDGEEWPGFVMACGLHTKDGWQLVVRALLFRLVARSELVRREDGAVDVREGERFEMAVRYARLAMKQLGDEHDSHQRRDFRLPEM